MDDKTMQRLENYREAERQCDEKINMLDNIWGDKLYFPWLEILMFSWEKGRQGVASRRVKEMFIENAYEKLLEQNKF